MAIIIIKACVILSTYFISYYFFGILCNRLLKKVDESFTLTMLKGMFLYSIVFFCYAIPMKYNKVHLHVTAEVWGIIWTISILAIGIGLRRSLFIPFSNLLGTWRENKSNMSIVSGLTLGQIVFVELFGRWNGSYNPTVYVGYITTGVFNDQMGTYDPVTGLASDALDCKLLTQTTLDYSAVISKIFSVHPLIEVRDVLPVIYIIMANLIIWMTATEICGKHKGKQLLFYTAYQCFIAVTTSLVLLGGYYYYFRNYEGKAVSYMIVATLYYYIIWKLYHDINDKEVVILGTLCCAASFHFTGTSLYLVPATMIGLVPMLFEKGKMGRTIKVILLMCWPSILYAIYYVFALKGLIPGVA